MSTLLKQEQWLESVRRRAAELSPAVIGIGSAEPSLVTEAQDISPTVYVLGTPRVGKTTVISALAEPLIAAPVANNVTLQLQGLDGPIRVAFFEQAIAEHPNGLAGAALDQSANGAAAAWIFCLSPWAWKKAEIVAIAVMLRSPYRPGEVAVALTFADSSPDLSTVATQVAKLRVDIREQLRQRGVDQETADRFSMQIEIVPVCAFAALQRQSATAGSINAMAADLRRTRFPTAEADGTAPLRMVIARACSREAAESRALARSARVLLARFIEVKRALDTLLRDAEQTAKQDEVAALKTRSDLATTLGAVHAPDLPNEIPELQSAVERALLGFGALDVSMPGNGKGDLGPVSPSAAWSDGLVHEIMRDEPAAVLGSAVRTVIEDTVWLVRDIQLAASAALCRNGSATRDATTALDAEGERARERMRNLASEMETAAVLAVGDALKIFLEQWAQQQAFSNTGNLSPELRGLLASPRVPIGRIGGIAIGHVFSILGRELQGARTRMIEIVGEHLNGRSSQISEAVGPVRDLLDEIRAREPALLAAVRPFIEGRAYP